eukprot:5010600-Prymnesium_polylepis.1
MHGGRWMVRAGEAAVLHEKAQCYRTDAGYNLDSALPEAMAAGSVKTTALAVRSCHAFVIDKTTLACMLVRVFLPVRYTASSRVFPCTGRHAARHGDHRHDARRHRRRRRGAAAGRAVGGREGDVAATNCAPHLRAVREAASACFDQR